MKDYYKILEIDEKATKNQIKKSYHKMALRYHPDKNKDNEELFKEAVEAYEVLYDDTKRRRYDLSRKLKEDYKFVLPPEILNFSKYFFSEENISKFTDFASIINNGIQNLSMNTKFDDLFNMLLNRIRNNNLSDLYQEYRDFKKFYKVDNLKKKKKKDSEIVKLNIPKKNKSDLKIDINKKKDIKVKVNVSLENIFNNITKSITLQVNEKCSICEGTGLVEKEENNENKKNSRNKKKKSKSKKNSFLGKKICPRCSGSMVTKKQRKFTINTSVDSICYQNSYFLNSDEGYCDIIFNINQKEHIIQRRDRYDLQIDYNISLYEMYFGGYFYLDYLDGKKYKMVWDGFGNNHTNNIKKIENMGLVIEDLDIRGDLYIQFNLTLPNYDKMLKYSNLEILKEIFNEDNIENKIGNRKNDFSGVVKEYNIINVI